MRELEADLGIPKTTVSEILMQDLGMKRVVAKFVPWQKEHCAALANDLNQTTSNEQDFFKVITLKGTEVSLSYVQCFFYPVSSAVNVSTFHGK